MIVYFFFFFFNDTSTTEIYTLSLHDALPIFVRVIHRGLYLLDMGLHLWSYYGCKLFFSLRAFLPSCFLARQEDRKSTRLNSSHANISYAVFCLKKKKKKTQKTRNTNILKKRI